MDEQERQELSRRLSGMTFKQARKEIFRLDRAASMAFYRNSMWDEFHTLFLLPNQGLSITLVEQDDARQTDDVAASSPGDVKKLKVVFKYIEARVDALDRPVKNAGAGERVYGDIPKR